MPLIDPSAELTECPQEDPLPEDTFTRRQILIYLAEFPIEYGNDAECEFAAKLIRRVQRHFAQLSTEWYGGDTF